MEEQNSKQEKRRLKKEEKIKNKAQAKRKKAMKGILNTVYVFLIIFGIIWVIWYFASSAKVLPTISSQGHSEDVPKSHILNEEMPESVQKHMLEHADGGGAPGKIIQYNCTKFECEEDLVDKLTAIAKKFPKSVYLAPSSKYDGKIILTAPGKVKILEEFDEKKINDFLNK